MSDWLRPADLIPIVRVLLDVCVRGSPNEGGLATNVGEMGDLVLRVVRYRPTVTCGAQRAGLSWETCRSLLESMSVDGRKVGFGPKEDPETVVPLPWKATTGERRCGAMLDVTGAEDVGDIADWYSLWLAAIAVDYMCVHRGMQGVALGLGE